MYSADDVREHCYGVLAEWLPGWTEFDDSHVRLYQCRVTQESHDIFKYDPDPFGYSGTTDTPKRFRVYIDVEEIEE